MLMLMNDVSLRADLRVNSVDKGLGWDALVGGATVRGDDVRPLDKRLALVLHKVVKYL